MILKLQSLSHKFRSTKNESCSEVTLQKTTLEPMQSLLNRARLRLKMTAAKVMDVIERLPDCAGQASDAVSAYTQVKLEDAPRLLRILMSR